MRWSQTFIPTLRESPSEAEIVSHQLMLRAGLIRKLSAGLYTFLPLGLRVLKKVEQIVREEMNRAGAIEVLMPALQPPEIWQQSGRYETAKDVFFKAKDRSMREWILGPTHEEVITSLVANEINSYRQLPKNFYQIQTKFRDEIRPRFGLMRAKEFIMKDAYSFDVDDAGAQVSYHKMYDAYLRIFSRCGLNVLPVEADTGVMGGKFSHEFMVPADSGECDIVFCESKDYAANIEKASSQFSTIAEQNQTEPSDFSKFPALERFPTPGVQTIADLEKPPFNIPADQQIKTLLYIIESKPVIVLLRGSDQLNENKLAAVTGSTLLRPATADEIFNFLGAHPGSLGAISITEIPVFADLCLKNAQCMVTGANTDGFHFKNVVIGRDIKVSQWADLRTVKAGEPCPVCGKPLQICRAIEVGHVFKLGTKYSVALGAKFLDESGKEQPAVMGCYGIGVTRTVQAIIEQHNDTDGIIWPKAVAPFTVCITPLEVSPESEVFKQAEKLYSELTAKGVEVILDDRDERPGVKFKDSELVGFPLRVSIGKRSLSKGIIELKPRKGNVIETEKDKVIEKILHVLNTLP